MSNATIAIIGAGNMGASLLGGLIAKHYLPNNLWITDTDADKLSLLKKQFQIHTTVDNHAALAQADVIILAVKPQMLSSVVQELAESIQVKKPLIISIAAGIRISSLQQWLGDNIAIVRAMPNTPALLGCGATGLFANALVSKDQRTLAESILSSVGIALWINDEKLMDVITPLSGSGPAYFFLVIEALQNAAIELGMEPEAARLLTIQTALGSARMASESELDVVELRRRVTSPGGTTERAVQSLEENNIRHLFKAALTAAKERSEELATLFDKPTE